MYFSHGIIEKFLHMQNNQLALARKLVLKKRRGENDDSSVFRSRAILLLFIDFMCDIIYIVAQKATHRSYVFCVARENHAEETVISSSSLAPGTGYE